MDYFELKTLKNYLCYDCECKEEINILPYNSEWASVNSENSSSHFCLQDGFRNRFGIYLQGMVFTPAAYLKRL